MFIQRHFDLNFSRYSSLMASSSSSSSSRTWTYRVFTSFHGPDVRKTFLSHLRKQFSYNGISMFDDQGIERSQIIAPALTQAIRESRISIVVLSKNYASSSWCLDELVEIFKCKEGMGQIVMTVFYGVDPSDVRKQTGKFGRAFNEMCGRKTEEERLKWSQVLTDAGNIAGEDFRNWENEAEMIDKIARDVSVKLNTTPSRDFDGMVGLEAHLTEMQSLLHLDYSGTLMVGIYGPTGIGKTTIARALQNLLSHGFQLTSFVDNLRGSCERGLDDHGLKLRLQEHFLSKVLNQNGMRICHLGAVKERLCDLKVLIILDAVNDVKQLEALANEITWFGPGSRIIVTTENQELLQQHGIDIIYHVGFPSREEALEILCINAFRQNYPQNGFQKLAKRATELCGNLPLGLRVVGSSLRKKKQEEWEEVMRRLETILGHRDIEQVLRVGYENLHENEQSLFLHIAVFFNNKHGNLVIAMLDDKRGLEILFDRSLIYISTKGEIVMHKLLQQVGRQAIQRQEPWKRQILIDAREICDVLEDDTGTRLLSGISFDTSGIDELLIRKGAFKRMSNLRYLSVYKSKDDRNDRMHIPEGMEFPRRLRLLDWEAYPSKCLPPTFHTEYLVELNMPGSQLEYLWQGTQRLTNLKKMNLYGSLALKELPDLSHATNLERLNLTSCESLVELPSSIENLHKLEDLEMNSCRSLEIVPTHINLASLQQIDMGGCSRLRSFPEISTNIVILDISDTAVEEVPTSISMWYSLWSLSIRGTGNLKTITQFHERLFKLDLSYTDIEKIPDCNNGLEYLCLAGCRKLTSLPELPDSLISPLAEDCESLETVVCPLNTPKAHLNFTNCNKLSQETQRGIIQRQTYRYMSVILPGREIPREFDHRDSMTIGPFSASSRFMACLKISRNKQKHPRDETTLNCKYKIIGKSGFAINIVTCVVAYPRESTGIRTEHLFTFHCDLPEDQEICLKLGSEISFEFDHSPIYDSCEIIECGVRILTERSCEVSHRRCKVKPNADIEKLPDWIKDFHGLEELTIAGCPKLASLPEFPSSLRKLTVDGCESLETLMPFPLDSQIEELYFPNCFKLRREARRIITEQLSLACLPGRTMPGVFDHRAKGNFLTIRSDFKFCRICAVVSPKLQMNECRLLCRIHLNGCLIEEYIDFHVDVLQTEHLFLSRFYVFEKEAWLEQDNEISFELGTSLFGVYVVEKEVWTEQDNEISFGFGDLVPHIDVIECGVCILGYETDGGYASSSEPDNEECLSDGSNE